MTQEIKGLIEKIQQEGIQVAEEKAAQIQNQAQETAKQIIIDAKAEAQKILLQAKQEVARSQESTKSLLAQAARDMLISLRAEIQAMLHSLLVTYSRQALPAEALGKIIAVLIKEYGMQRKDTVVVTLRTEEVEKIGKILFSELGEQAKKGILLKGSDDVQAGFLISWDGGSSQFTFTDQALAEYIAVALNPRLKDFLIKASSSDK